MYGLTTWPVNKPKRGSFIPNGQQSRKHKNSILNLICQQLDYNAFGYIIIIEMLLYLPCRYYCIGWGSSKEIIYQKSIQKTWLGICYYTTVIVVIAANLQYGMLYWDVILDFSPESPVKKYLQPTLSDPHPALNKKTTRK